MTGEEVLLRLASSIPASLGVWATAAAFLGLFRVRDATLRAALWTWAAASTVLVVLGLASASVFELSVSAPADSALFEGGTFVVAGLTTWCAGAGALVAMRLAKDARLLCVLDGIATTSPVPEDLAEAVARAARWIGVGAPRIAAAQTDGTAFVAGVRDPMLFVPLALWRRLDTRGRRALLLHELAHIRRRDALRLRVLSLAVAVLWPAVFLRWTAARLRDAWEAQADEEAVHAGATRGALAHSLVEASAPSSPAGVLAFGGSAKATARRLASLRKRMRAPRLVLQVLLLAFFVPWLPRWDGAGTRFLVTPPRSGATRGLVRIAFAAGGNPFFNAIFWPLAERLGRLEPPRD